MLVLGDGLLARGFASIPDDDGPDDVIFAAGVADSRCLDTRAFGREQAALSRALRLCRAQDRRIVYFSSAGHVYGAYPSEVSEDRPLRPCTAFGRHKKAMEELIRISGVRHLVLRLTNVVGPRQSGHQLIASLTRQVLGGRVEVWRGALRDLVAVRDVVALCCALRRATAHDATLNLGSGTSVPVRWIVSRLASHLGRRPQVRFIERPDSYSVRVDLLRASLPAGVPWPFGPDYPERVLRDHARGSRDDGVEAGPVPTDPWEDVVTA